MSITREKLATLRFVGARFEGHTLDVDCTTELIAYKRLVIECAKELWRRRHPGRERLPSGFEESFSLSFSEVAEGSASIPLLRVMDRDDSELNLESEDEFIEAARLIDETISAAANGQTLPSELPRNVIPLFREFGKTLSLEETLYTQARDHRTEASYSADARERLANWVESVYEDSVELIGEASMANLRGSQFMLTLADGMTVGGKFSPEQEAPVLEALRMHREVRLRVRGLAEFNQADRSLRRLVRVDDAEIAPPTELAYDDAARPIWEVLAEIGASAPAEAWDKLPTDLSKRLDDYIYRAKPQA